VKTVPERLQVFVSSTIKECAPERQVAKRAISSLNHEPILFEEIGARPHPPRDVYTARIAASHVFVGIYRSNYGWIAPDMEISGVEDEWRLARDRGMDQLLYVQEPAHERDGRLTSLIKEMKESGSTVSFYQQAEDLHDRIRDDITAVVSERFTNTVSLHDVDDLGPRAVLEGILPNESHRLRRPQLENALLDQLINHHYVVVDAPMGFGKTVLLAQLASDQQWVFLDGRGLTSDEVLAKCTNVLRLQQGYQPIPFVSAEEAKKGFKAIWERLDSVTLVVDALAEPDLLYEALEGRARLSAGKRLVVAARGGSTKFPQARFAIPALARDEIASWVSRLRGSAPNPMELATLAKRSAGNPLYLRYYALGQHSDAEADLQELEIRNWSGLEATGREALSYMALIDRRFGLVDLKALLGGEGVSIETVAAAIGKASHLLRRSGHDLELVHEHLRESIVAALEASPERLSFYAARLGDYLREKGDFVSAFLVLDRFGEHRTAEELVEAAANQATLAGGGVTAAYIHKRSAEIAKSRLDWDTAIQSLLNLALASQQAGDLKTSTAAIEEARAILLQSGKKDWAIRIEEAELSLSLIRQGLPDLLERLMRLKEAYGTQDEPFDAARIALTLSMVYVDSAEYELAAEQAKEALYLFEAIGDSYGARTAKFNLASAYSGLPSHHDESISLMRELEHDGESQEGPRERLLLCNMYTRRHRESGNTELAARFAQEAISIGESLGDLRTVAINRINLGNVYRQEDRVEAALEEYEAADRAAHEASLARLEAAANELIASVHNQVGRWALGRMHAEHAVGLLRDSSDSRTLARALEERAKALEGEGSAEAAAAYVKAGRAAAAAGNAKDYAIDLLWEALRLDADPNRSSQLLLHVAEFLDIESLPPLVDGSTVSVQLEAFKALLLPLSGQLTPLQLIPVIALLSHCVLGDGPSPLVQYALTKMAEFVIASASEFTPAKAAAILGSLIAIAQPDQFSLAQLAKLAEDASAKLNTVSFKPHHDGAAHWTLEMQFSSRVTCTLDELDDSSKMAATCFVITMWLVALAEELQEAAIKIDQIPRVEAQIQISTFTGASQYVADFLRDVRLGPENLVVVTEATNLESETPPPLIAICYDDLAKSWKPTKDRISPYHILLASVAERLIVHILRGRVERESLRPKLAGVIRRLASRAPKATQQQ
jgi:tetratricopeptide (TPR) repeat protein